MLGIEGARLMIGGRERTARLTGTAVLATLVIVFDYTLKFSCLKIPFLWLPAC